MLFLYVCINNPSQASEYAHLRGFLNTSIFFVRKMMLTGLRTCQHFYYICFIRTELIAPCKPHLP